MMLDQICPEIPFRRDGVSDIYNMYQATIVVEAKHPKIAST